MATSKRDYTAVSVLQPEKLLRESRRQRNIAEGSVPLVCVLDTTGDILRALIAAGSLRRNPFWACAHTDMYVMDIDGQNLGLVGRVIGAPFAVLIAEQMFASGCRLLVSFAAASQLAPSGPAPYLMLIDRALRDEGTSDHYLPPSPFAAPDPALIARVAAALASQFPAVRQGATWTTDAPFRETQASIDAAREHGALAVEMEAAALYAFAQARGKAVICFAHVTTQIAKSDVEQAAANVARDAMALIAATARAWRQPPAP